ncbi:Hypothetical predicted protein [Cloeon dipterum]|uniref:Uncharacterized protein n=1 Tax=Cloeon dipterum TaxID=197152 RepID=A0A8S1C107_9INSE|nr:Hypothetical predicted protein [Cloeon dipterum]
MHMKIVEIWIRQLARNPVTPCYIRITLGKAQNMVIPGQRMHAKRNTKPKKLGTPPSSELQRKGSVGSITYSKTRLLTNNRHLALQLNKKRVEVHRLREANQKLSRSFEASKRAFRNLAEKYNNSVTLLRKVQQMAPKVQQDICKAMSKYVKVFSPVEEFDLENLENFSFLDNLDLTDDMTRKTNLRPFCHKRAAVHRVRPMKFGLVLGNPVVSLHRLQAPSDLLGDIEEYSSESDNDIQDETAAVEPDPIARCAQPGTNLRSSITTARISPSKKIAELTLSVPVLQPMDSTSATSSKRIRLEQTRPNSTIGGGDGENYAQLTTPCRVMVEHLSEDHFRLNGSPLLCSQHIGLPMLQSTPSNVTHKRRANHSVDERRAERKVTDEELIRALTPMQRKRQKKLTPCVSKNFNCNSADETMKAAGTNGSLTTDEGSEKLHLKRRAVKRAKNSSNHLTVKMWANKSYNKKKCSIEQEELKLPDTLPNITKRRGKRNAELALNNSSQYNEHSKEIDGEEHLHADKEATEQDQISRKTFEPQQSEDSAAFEREDKQIEGTQQASKAFATIENQSAPKLKPRPCKPCPKSKKPSNSDYKKMSARVPVAEMEDKQVDEARCEGGSKDKDKVPRSMMDYSKPKSNVACPKSKKVQDEKETDDTPNKARNLKVKKTINSEAKTARVPVALKEAPVSEPHAPMVTAKPKTCKPMPLSKKIQLVNNIKKELITSSTVYQDEYMKKFYQRLSLEDPLEAREEEVEPARRLRALGLPVGIEQAAETHHLQIFLRERHTLAMVMATPLH